VREALKAWSTFMVVVTLLSVLCCYQMTKDMFCTIDILMRLLCEI